MNQRNNPPPMPPFDIRPMRAETRPHAVHVRNPAGAKRIRRAAKAITGARHSYSNACHVVRTRQ